MLQTSASAIQDPSKMMSHRRHLAQALSTVPMASFLPFWHAIGRVLVK